MFEKKNNFSINYIELKYRTFYFFYCSVLTFFVCFYYKIELFFMISNFFLLYKEGFIYTNLLDPIFIYFKLVIFCSILLLYPFFLYLYGFFFIKSFYDFYLKYFIFYFSTLYVVGLYLLFIISKVFLPFLFSFLLGFQRLNQSELFELTLQATITQYYSFFFSYLIVCLSVIIIPNCFLILLFLNIINSKNFLNYKLRKYLYIFIIIIFLVIAPPDFTIQLLVFPIIIFFLEFFIYLIIFFYTLYNSF